MDAPQKELPVAEVAHTKEFLGIWLLSASFPAGFLQPEHRGAVQHTRGGSGCREEGFRGDL